jgi:hypothetical protein
MKEYILTLIAAALSASLIGILSPDGERGGIARHMRLLIALFMAITLISPIRSLLSGIRDWTVGSGSLPPSVESLPIDPDKTLSEALQNASEAYFTDMLTQAIETKFAIGVGDVRCAVAWQAKDGTLAPKKVTVLLSGHAVWKNPEEIEAFVHGLLGCECAIAIE